jgi:hypothetical protein
MPLAIHFSYDELRVGRTGESVPYAAVRSPACVQAALDGGCEGPLLERRLVEELALILCDLFSRVLLLKPGDQRLVLVAPALAPPVLRDALTAVLLGPSLGVPGLLWLAQPEAALFSTGCTSGLVVDTDDAAVIPVHDCHATPSQAVPTGVRTGHMAAAAAFLLLTRLRVAGDGRAVPAAGVAPRERGGGKSVHPLLPPASSNTLGRAFPPFATRGWSAALDDTAVFPTAHDWYAAVVTGRRLPVDAAHGLLGETARWVEGLLARGGGEGGQGSALPPARDGMVELPVPSAIAGCVGLQARAGEGAQAKAAGAFVLHVPKELWAAVQGIAYEPQGVAALLLEQGQPEAEGDGCSEWESSGLGRLTRAAREALMALEVSEAVPVQEAVCVALWRAPMHERRVLARALVPSGTAAGWCPSFPSRLVHAVGQHIRTQAGSGDARMGSLLPLLPLLAAFDHAALRPPALPWAGGSAYGAALGGPLPVPPHRRGDPTARRGKAPVTRRYVGGNAALPALPSGALAARPDALAEACITTRHMAALAATMGIVLDAEGRSKQLSVPLGDWAACAQVRATTVAETGPQVAPGGGKGAGARATTGPTAAARLEGLSARLKAARK